MTGRRLLGLVTGLFGLMVLLTLTLVTLVALVSALLAPGPQARPGVLGGILAGCLVLWVVLVGRHRRRRAAAGSGPAASGVGQADRHADGGNLPPR